MARHETPAAAPANLFSGERPVRSDMVTLRLTAAQGQVLDQAATQAGVNRSELLRVALDFYLAAHPITPEQPKPPKAPKPTKKRVTK